MTRPGQPPLRRATDRPPSSPTGGGVHAAARLHGRRAPAASSLTTPLWVWPAVSAVAALVAASLLGRIHVDPSSALARWTWPGDRDAATALLQVVAGSVMTVTSLTFSLVIVTFQLASQQFSPRLLRELARDPVTRAVLAVLVATFIFSVAVLRVLEGDETLPTLAVAGSLLLGVASVIALLGFLTHIARLVRVETMMVALHRETERTIATFYPERGERCPPPPGPDMEPPVDADRHTSRASGFVRRVDVEGLCAAAARAGRVVHLDVRAGDHVVRGTPIARSWRRGAGGADVEVLEDGLDVTVELGYERTPEQDASLGFRQLTDIAVKALSPGINDPVTAAHAIGYSADLLVSLTDKRLGPSMHADAAGVWRAVVPDRDWRYYLDLVCGAPRRYARREPTVLIALLRMLRDVATSMQDDEGRGEIDRQTQLIVDEIDDGLLPADVADVRSMALRVRHALHGDLGLAYEDRAGESRSI